MKKFPVTEIFGPTVQGEGVDQGLPVYFVRFGGCDFKCTWCDTPHAVLPENVRHARRMDENEIVASLEELPEGPRMVVLSGGNPALHDLSMLCGMLKARGMQVAIETQGTAFKSWMTLPQRICISPKPPSSGMKYTKENLENFLGRVFKQMGGIGAGGERFYDGRVFIKIVVFDNTDYEWAKEMFLHVNEISGGMGLPYFVSAGNDAGATVGNPSRRDNRTSSQVATDLLNKTRWLVNKVMVDPLMNDVRVQSQFHVLLWGNMLGV